MYFCDCNFTSQMFYTNNASLQETKVFMVALAIILRFVITFDRIAINKFSYFA